MHDKKEGFFITIRKFLLKIVEKPIFEIIILGVIVLASILLVIDNPLSDPNGKL